MKNINKAFTLIELIFAIVIIGIVFSSVPYLLDVASNANKEESKQCIIFKTYEAITKNYSVQWDENSINSSGISNIVNVSNGDSELINIGSNRRNGSLDDFKNHRKFGVMNASPLQRDSGDDNNASKQEDLDDWIGSIVAYDCNLNNGELNITTSVKYINDKTDYSGEVVYFDFNPKNIASSGTTNIKMVEIASLLNGEMVAKFRIFSSNIGEFTPYREKQ